MRPLNRQLMSSRHNMEFRFNQHFANPLLFLTSSVVANTPTATARAEKLTIKSWLKIMGMLVTGYLKQWTRTHLGLSPGGHSSVLGMERAR
jgi:hypothetical protein